MKQSDEEIHKVVIEEVMDELYFQYESDHGFRMTVYTHPSFYNGTVGNENLPDKPELLMTKEQFIEEVNNNSKSKWFHGAEVLYSYIFRQHI